MRGSEGRPGGGTVSRPSFSCCICGMEFEGYGNNAAPVRDGVCCDECNARVVVPERLRLSAVKEK